MGYFTHLGHAWRMSFMLFIHGLIPSIWTNKVSDEIIDYSNAVKELEDAPDGRWNWYGEDLTPTKDGFIKKD